MKCPSCQSKVGFINKGRLLASLNLKKTMPCPFCNATIHKQTNSTRDYFGLIFFAMLWFGLVLFLLAIIFAKQIGLKMSLLVCFWYWVVVVVVFIAIILLNLAAICVWRLYLLIGKRHGG